MGRLEDNQALSDLDELVSIVLQLDVLARPVLIRNRFTPGRHPRQKGEMGEEEGTPPPGYADPTGDDAVWPEDFTDSIGKTLRGLARVIGGAGSLTKWLVDLSSTDVTKRVERTIPNCLACGDPCLGRVLSAFDEKCYKRWVRGGRIDRTKFIAQIQAERQVVDDEE